MVAGWRRFPPPVDPAAASRWTWHPAETRDSVTSVLVSAPVPDEHPPLPSVDPPHPRLERFLAVVAPWWVARRQAARVARYQHAVWRRVAVAHDARDRARDLPSRYGPAWRGSRFWHR
jgi:hypothetical protein